TDHQPPNARAVAGMRQLAFTVGVALSVGLIFGSILWVEGIRLRVAGLAAAAVAILTGAIVRSFLFKAGPQQVPSSTSPQQPPVDSYREVIETVVFVIVLVLMLKSFVAEAFVIPTGSMAETLYGYQKIVQCPQCDTLFPVNCSGEVDPPRGQRPQPVTS